MATGGPTAWKLEVDWTGTGVYVDETAYLMADDGHEVVITRGRENDADDMQPGVLTGTLDNAREDLGSVGRFTPDNPLSALWPNVVDDVKTRFSVTRPGGTAIFRHQGTLTLSTPTLDDGEVARAVVPIQSVGVLGRISRVPLLCDWLEQMRQESETQTVDVFPMDDAVSATSRTPLRNLGSGTGVGTIYRAATSAGTVVSETPEGIDFESSYVLTPTSAGIGPVIQLETSVPAGSVNVLLVTFRTADRTTGGGPDKYLLTALKADGSTLFSVRLKDNAGQTDLNLYDASGTFVATLYFGFAPSGTDPGDDQWFSLVAAWAGSATNFFVRRVADSQLVAATGIAGIDVRQTDTLVLGGLLSKKRTPGKQVQCTAARFAGAAISTGTFHGATYLEPDALTNAVVRFIDMNFYCDYGSAQFGTRNRPVRRKSQTGRTGFQMLAELARTTGAVIVESRVGANTLFWYDSDTQRLPTVALAIDLDLDADSAGGLPMRKGDVPSSVTASWTGGSVTFTDATRTLNSDSVDTCAADVAGALDVASSRVNASRRLRLESLRIDLAGSGNDLWLAVMSLEIGARIRINLVPGGTLSGAAPPLVQHYGVTYLDVYVVGWKEHYSRDAAYWDLDTIPADDPVEAVTDDATYGRTAAGVQTAAAGTLSGTAGTGTVVVTTVSGLPLSTASGDYPQDFRYGGERVTVTSPPGSAVSPQTVTVTARGVAPSVAKVHSGSESWDVWLPAAATW